MNHSVVFFDPTVAQHRALADSLRGDATWVVLDHRLDGLQQMAAYLAGHGGLDAIHVVSHGVAGALCLGNTVVSSDLLAEHVNCLRAIGQSLGPGGDILLYGCNVAAGETGRSFIADLAGHTGANVAASVVPTGAAARGGDAALEVHIGAVTALPLFTQATFDRLGVCLGTLPGTVPLGGFLRINPAGYVVKTGELVNQFSVPHSYEFVPDVSGLYSINIRRDSSLLDVQFRVYGSDGAPLTGIINNHSGDGYETVSLKLTEGAVTRFAVTGVGDSFGNYIFQISGPDSVAPEMAPSGPSYAGSWQAAVNNYGDIDYWRLTAPPGTNKLDLSVTPTGFDSAITLHDIDGRVVFHRVNGALTEGVNNAGSGVADTLSSLPVTPGQTLFLGVHSVPPTGVGSYRVNVDYNPDQVDFGDPPATITPDTGTVLKLNPFGYVTDTDTVSPPGEFVFNLLYQFHVESPGNHVFTVHGALDSQFRVYDSSGAALTAIVDKVAAGVPESTTLDLGSTEWVYLLVAGYQNQTGTFTLSINGPTYDSFVIPTAAPNFTGSSGGSIGTQGDIDYWSISAPLGSNSLDLSVAPSAALDTVMELYDSSGVLLQTINQPAPLFQGNGVIDSATGIAVTAGSRYFVGISSTSRTQTGSYTLNVDFNPDTAKINFASSAASITEGDSLSQQLNFTVSLSAASASAVTVNYATANGSATAGSDYTAASGTLSFAAGETSKTIAVSVLGDTLVESDETFTLALTKPAGAVLGTTIMATATILDNDTAATSRTVLGTPGNDNNLRGGGGNDSFDGDAGIDTAVYAGGRSNFTLTRTTNGHTVADKTGAEGTDALVNVERLQFSDFSVALDVSGHAGTTAKILGAVFGKASVTNKEYAGIGLQLLDGGTSYLDLMLLALGVRLGGASNADVVNLLYSNVVGSPPPADEFAFFKAMLDSGAHTPASLGVLAADTDLNSVNVNLVGLATNGLEYLPQG